MAEIHLVRFLGGPKAIGCDNYCSAWFSFFHFYFLLDFLSGYGFSLLRELQMISEQVFCFLYFWGAGTTVCAGLWAGWCIFGIWTAR